LRCPQASVAKVKIAEDGTIIVYHGADDVGQCVIRGQVAAEEFAISVDQVKVIFQILSTPLNAGSIKSRHLSSGECSNGGVPCEETTFEIAAQGYKSPE
jgi:CO/xanthine dehydrogenase Mo-binding subunit